MSRQAYALGLAFALLLVVSPAEAVHEAGRGTSGPPASDRVIVRVDVDPSDAAQAGQAVAAASGLSFSNDLGDGFVVLEAKGRPARAAAALRAIAQAAERSGAGRPPPSAADDALAQAVYRAQVSGVEEDYIVEAQATATECPSGTACTGLWGMTAIRAPQAWALVTGSATIAPATSTVLGSVIDTGAQYAHVELDTQAVRSLGATFSNGALTGDGSDNNGHGTHVSGTMAAKWGGASGSIAGVAGNADLAVCKFLDASGSGYVSDVVLCIRHIASKNAQAVINNSWGGGGYSSAVHYAIRDYVCARGGLFVAAAGNSGADISAGGGAFPAYYSAYAGAECVLPVAATDSSTTLASFSNYGAAVPIAAPGVSIRSTMWSTTSLAAETTLSGTSMACPHVSGVAFLLRNEFPSLTGMQIKAVLVRTATAAVKPYGSRTIGGGLLNAEAAYREAQLLAGVAPPPSPSPSPSPPPPTTCSNCSPPNSNYCATCSSTGSCVITRMPRSGVC